MSDRESLLLQLIVPVITAIVIFLLRPRLRNKPVEGGCLSTLAATTIIAALLLATAGVTSTLPIGLAFTCGIGFIVSVTILAVLRSFRSS